MANSNVTLTKLNYLRNFLKIDVSHQPLSGLLGGIYDKRRHETRYYQLALSMFQHEPTHQQVTTHDAWLLCNISRFSLIYC